MLHLIHLPDSHSKSGKGHHAGLLLALRTGVTLPGKHLVVAINNTAKLDTLYPAQRGHSFEFGSITPPLGDLNRAFRAVGRIIDRWRPHAVVLWHDGLEGIGHSLAKARRQDLLIIEGWNAPTAAPDEHARNRESELEESTALATPVSAMGRSLAREQLGILQDDERPLITLLPNVPASADAWWFSVILGMLESANIQVIGAIPSLARQRGRGRRYRHACALASTVIEYDRPLKLMMAASDVIISAGRDTDSDVELEETATLSSGVSVLDRVVICQSLAAAIPTIVTPAHASVVPAGLRKTLVAEGTRASKIAARLHQLLAHPESLDQARRVLRGSMIPNPDAEIVAWVRDRMALREIHAHSSALAGSP